MEKQLKVGSKVGYLRTKTGRYEWNIIIEMNEHSVRLERDLQGKAYRFWDITKDVINYSKTFSKDFPNKTLIKF